MLRDDRLLQIIPAVGWWAAFTGKDGSVFVDRVICWALTIRDEIEGVEGMLEAGGYIDFVEYVENFAGYVFAPSEADAVIKARKHERNRRQ